MSERVWDRFLTEQDKAHVAMKASSPIGFGKKPALLLIDLYRWVFGDKPEPVLEAIKEWPGSCGMAGWDAIPHIQTLLQAAREAGIPIIHISGLPGAGVDEWSFRRDTSSTNLSAEALERRRNKFDIIDEVQPLPGEAVLRKLSPSAFWGTPLMGAPEPTRHRYGHRLRREHQRLRARQRGGRLHLPVPHGGGRGMRVRPPRGVPRHQPLRHEPEVRRRAAAGRDRAVSPRVAGGTAGRGVVGATQPTNHTTKTGTAPPPSPSGRGWPSFRPKSNPSPSGRGWPKAG